MSASRTRRQMIQRMGRILRRKRPGIAARFVIMFAKDTLEDPANRFERDGFLDEIERISDASGVFDSAQFDELDAFLAEPGPELVPEPARADTGQSTRRSGMHVARPPRARRTRRRTSSSSSATCQPSPSRESSPSVVDRSGAARDRAHRVRHGGSAAPGAAKRRRSSSSDGRSSTRRLHAAVRSRVRTPRYCSGPGQPWR